MLSFGLIDFVNNHLKETLGQQIRAARRRQRSTLEDLSQKVNKTPQSISSIEMGRVIPSVFLLIQIHDALYQGEESLRSKKLGTWLLKWTEAHIQRDCDKVFSKEDQVEDNHEWKLIEQARARGLEAISQFQGTSIGSRVGIRNNSALPTLTDFPEGFDDLVIVCGDRRESPPKTKADIFVDSFSSADLPHLPDLYRRCGQPLHIRSDKLFALAERDYLKREFGEKHIIVLGSPAINLLARKVNESCIFRFAVPRVAREFTAYLENKVPEINDPALLDVFWRMATQWREQGNSDIDAVSYFETYRKKVERIQLDQIEALANKVKELLNGHTTKGIKNLFHKPGFVDPADAQVHGESPRQDNDFGVISLCPNPYSTNRRHLCILVAGIHAPGTDQALRVLATDDFQEHPLGGIIEAKINLQAGWIERLYKASFDWQTKPYRVGDVLSNLSNCEKFPVFKKCAPESIKSLLSFANLFVDASTLL